jgi:error-prone DNA polymerase
VLERTLGVPLFQEQLMQMAMSIGGINGDDADLLDPRNRLQMRH